jgi:V-type ATPase 116kDa subunit family
MDVFIVSKWLTDYSGREHEAPSIITQMINNVLKGGEIHGSPLLGQNQAQKVESLLIICVLCVPVMLVVKPWVLKRRQEDAERS